MPVRRWLLRSAIALIPLAGVTHDAVAADIGETAAADGRFTTFVEAMRSDGAANELREAERPLTVFAPTDDAFRRLPGNLLDKLLAPQNEDALDRVIALHIVPGASHEADDLPVVMRPLGDARLMVAYTGSALTLRVGPAAAKGAPPPAAAVVRRPGWKPAACGPTTALSTRSTPCCCRRTSVRCSPTPPRWRRPTGRLRPARRGRPTRRRIRRTPLRLARRSRPARRPRHEAGPRLPARTGERPTPAVGG